VVGLALALVCATLGTTAAAAPQPNASKRVVVGGNGYLFSSQDWTVPCQDAPTTVRTARLLVELGDALRDSGRQAVVTVGPDKSTVMTGHVPSSVPVRECHASQHSAYWGTATSSPQFLDLRRPLQQAARSAQVYYRKDTHWSHNGDAVYTRALAQRFDPVLALALRSRTTTGTVRGDLASVLGLPAHESVQGQSVLNPRVAVQELPERSIGLIVPVKTFRATAALGGRLLPGRTVFVGDSFTAVALNQLAQLSQETVFVWTDNSAPLQPMLDEIAKGDRVVVEVVERLSTRFRMFRTDVVDGARRLPFRVVPQAAAGV
jgi:hypothetical protein